MHSRPVRWSHRGEWITLSSPALTSQSLVKQSLLMEHLIRERLGGSQRQSGGKCEAEKARGSLAAQTMKSI